MKKGLALLAAVLSAPVLTAHAGSFTPLYTFTGGTDGAYATGVPLVVGKVLYGATSAGGNSGCLGAGCGTVYAISLKTNSETVLHRFSDDTMYLQYGQTPQGGVTMVGSLLYGAAEFGGVNAVGAGVLFSIDPGTGNENIVYSFDRAQIGRHGLITNGFTLAKGLLYGTTLLGPSNAGFVYTLDPATAKLNIVYTLPLDSEPNSPVTVNGTASYVWGTSATQLFAQNLKNAKGKFLYTFDDLTAGYAPSGGMTLVNGTLYGADIVGGSQACPGVYDYGCGTLFSFSLSAHAMSVAHYFAGGADGAQPATGPIVLNGLLYGTTNLGGANNTGTIYSYDPSTGIETVLYSMPAAALSQANSGLVTDGVALYGSYGQPGGLDVVYKFVP